MAQDEILNRVHRATDALLHRGPDDGGHWTHGSTGLGHRRLAILDLSASIQPMADPSNRYVLSFNGEIYNYRELRSSLQSDWSFNTQGDTEVILAGLVIHGTGFIKRLEGMWGFSFWDSETETLILSRDRMGKKPVFYQFTNRNLSVLSCSSELTSLACLSPGSWNEDHHSTADYFKYGYYLPGCTAYKDVFELLPGHFLEWKPGHQPQLQSYWQLEKEHFTGSRREACDQLHEHFINAVKSRLIADVEVGAFLSGGVDSSLVVGIMSKYFQNKPKTFTIGFSESAYDERDYAKIIADQYKTDHYTDCLDVWDKSELTSLLLKHVGQPFTDSSLLPTAMVSRLASKYVKVALTGDGGDELFCGYQRYHARSILRWYSRLPRFFRNNIERLIKLLPEPMEHHSRSLLKKAHLFCDVVNRLDAETPYIAPVFYSHDNFRNLVPDLHTLGHKPPKIPEESNVDALGRMMIADALVYLPQDILTKVDRASMAYSLETRAPFLDREVVEFAFSLPAKWHYRRLKGKVMLLDSMHDYIPDRIWKRNKQGFGVPIHDWFRGELGQELVDLINTVPDLPFNKQFVLKMLDLHKKRIRDHGYRLWSIYVYILWKTSTPWLVS